MCRPAGHRGLPGLKLSLARSRILTYPADIMIAGMLIAVLFLLLGVFVFTFLQKA